LGEELLKLVLQPLFHSTFVTVSFVTSQSVHLINLGFYKDEEWFIKLKFVQKGTIVCQSGGTAIAIG